MLNLDLLHIQVFCTYNVQYVYNSNICKDKSSKTQKMMCFCTSVKTKKVLLHLPHEVNLIMLTEKHTENKGGEVLKTVHKGKTALT